MMIHWTLSILLLCYDNSKILVESIYSRTHAVRNKNLYKGQLTYIFLPLTLKILNIISIHFFV
jgi:hypothetical protein